MQVRLLEGRRLSMVTIKDIAAKAGVSIATVSRVMNGQAGVSKSKRHRVLEVAQELDYNPQRTTDKTDDTTPEIMVLYLGLNGRVDLEDQIGYGVLLAESCSFPGQSEVEFYTSDDLDRAMNTFQILQNNEDEDLRGLVVIGSMDSRLKKPLEYLRGKGTPVVLAESDVPEIPPLLRVYYDYDNLFKTLQALVPRIDKSQEGLGLYGSERDIKGQGFCTAPYFNRLLDFASDYYGPDHIHIQNGGPFNPELFKDTSLLILDNEKASLEAVRYYEKQDQRPFIIGYGTGKDMIDAMDRNKLDLLAYFSPYKLGFMPVYALAKRLNNKNEPLPENLPIFPEFILPGQVDYLNFKEVYPLLIDDKLKFEAQIRPDKDKA